MSTKTCVLVVYCLPSGGVFVVFLILSFCLFRLFLRVSENLGIM